jgi:DNA invertase Pin-like site-specific DNA recombinase
MTNSSSRGQRVGYVRVSSVDQSTERQLEGIALDEVFTDKASGKDTHRPQLEAALRHVRKGDTLVVHSMDRLARSLVDLERLVDDLTKRGVTVQFVKERLTFNGSDDPFAVLMRQIIGSVAQFERSMIRERQREGIAIAKAKGVYKGRKRVLTLDEAAELRQLAYSGIAKTELAKSYGISRQTLYEYLNSGA